MAESPLPIVLKGDNLGERHRHLNRLVNESYLDEVSFSSIKELPETTVLDRIFKINLASKYKDVDLILENLKHDDMLNVSTALKSTWLLDAEYSDVVNPEFVENVLYSEMTAVTKMKHWIEINLKDPKRCQSFYQFYSTRNFDSAMKFLKKCSNNFILSEISKENVLVKLTPRHLKILIEKCAGVAKLFFSNLETNQTLLQNYLNNEFKYYETLKGLLKVDGDYFLELTEKYFNKDKFKRVSAEATKYIMKNFKQRFDDKPELYTYMLLDINILAKHLNTEEVKDLIIKLARASYLQHWFSYKNVEPLIKRLSVEERTTFKKLIFVQKDIGGMIEYWPYAIPSSPEQKTVCSYNIFMDKEVVYRGYRKKKRLIKKKKGNFQKIDIVSARKSSLDILFDRFRFTSFEKTLFDLRKQLTVETLQHRQNRMLVLISKTGGRFESLHELLKLLTERHINEPVHFRATVIRSLVRRCNFWRMPQNIWELFLNFGWSAGLDGKSSTVACTEGIHAIIIRHIILDQVIDDSVWKVYFKDFSTLKEYSLNATEKQKVATKLPELLILSAEKEPIKAVDRLNKSLDVLDAYNIRVDNFPKLITIISKTAEIDSKAGDLLRRLFVARVARRELFKENFAIIQNDASYYNALKHDTRVLAAGEAFENLIRVTRENHINKRSLKALAVYFNEKGGLAEKYLGILKKYNEDGVMIKNIVVCSIAILSKDELENLIKEFNDAPDKSKARRLLRKSNIWRILGPKAVANRALNCRTKDVDRSIQTLMNWKGTQKLGLILSMRIGKEVQILQYMAERRPRFTLKIMLKHVKLREFCDEVWDLIISIIPKLNSISAINVWLRKALSDVKLVPDKKKARYCEAVYELFRTKNMECSAQISMLCHIEHALPEIDQIFVEGLIQRFVNEEFTCKKLGKSDLDYSFYVRLIIKITAKYLLLCKMDSEINQKWDSLGQKFFDHFDAIWKATTNKTDLIVYLDDFILSLKYNKVFLDTGYVSCIPTFERIINRLQNILPLHEYFEKYIHLHLTIIYFKSVRESIKKNPNVFGNLPKKLHQSAEIVGRIFGKIVSYEVLELVSKYFESIIEVYKRDFRNFLDTYFDYGESKDIFVINIVKSILEHENYSVNLLAEHIYEYDRHGWPNEVRDEICESLRANKNVEVRFVFKSHF